MDNAYPTRDSFFACQFIRLLTKKCVANELGCQAFTLLTVIAMTEDARGYTDPVTFFNGQLFPLVGLGSEDALDRVRKKCIEAGWLHYVPGGRRSGPGRYWVTIPERHIGTDDAPTDEGADSPPLLRTRAEQSAEQSAGQNTVLPFIPPHQSGANREQTAGQTASKPRNLLPIPFPSPNTLTASAVRVSTPAKTKTPQKGKKAAPDACPLFARFWAAYPRKVAKQDAAKAFAKLAPDDALLAALLVAITQQAKSDEWMKESGRFIPYPATWLNGKRWEDQVALPACATNTIPAPPTDFGRQPTRKDTA